MAGGFAQEIGSSTAVFELLADSEAAVERLVRIEGVGETVARSFLSGLEMRREMVEEWERNDAKALAYLKDRGITGLEEVTEADRKALFSILSERRQTVAERVDAVWVSTCDTRG